MLRKRNVYKQIKQSKKISIGDDRIGVGFGYIIIPNDVDRDTYIRNVYSTGYCMIVTHFNEVIKDVLIPTQLIQELSFPRLSNQYGSLVSVSNVSSSNQVVIRSIHLKPGQYHRYKENVYSSIRENDEFKMSSIKNLRTGVWIMSHVNEDGSDGGIVLRSSCEDSSSSIKINADGTFKISADNEIEIYAEKSLNISIGSEEEEVSILTIDQEGSLSYTDKYDNKISIIEGNITIESPNIKIGDLAEQSAVLGDELKKQIEKDSKLLSTLITAISSAPVVPSDGGASFKSTLIAATKAFPSGSYSDILSEKVKIE